MLGIPPIYDFVFLLVCFLVFFFLQATSEKPAPALPLPTSPTVGQLTGQCLQGGDPVLAAAVL